MSKTIDVAKVILADETKLEKGSQLLGTTFEATKTFLEHLLRSPDITDNKVEEFISQSTNSALKAFYSGQQSGFKQGHSSGMGKGAAAGLVVGFLLGGLTAAGVVVKKFSS